MSSFKTLFPFLRQHWRKYAAGLTWLLVVDALQLVIPLVLGRFTDALQGGSLSPHQTWAYALLIMGSALVVAGCRYLWRMYLNGTSRLMERWLRDRLFARLLVLPPEFYDHNRTGDLMARMTNDVNAVRMAMNFGLVMLTDSLITTVSAIAIMLYTDAALAAAALLPMPLTAVVVIRAGQIIHVRFRKVQEAFSNLTNRVQENLAGIRVVQAFAQQEAEIAKFTSSNSHNFHANLHLARISAFFFPVVQYLVSLSFLVMLGYGGSKVMHGTLTLGSFVAMNGYLAMLVWPVMAIGWVINMVQRGAASMGRLNAILETATHFQDPVNPAPVEHLAGSVELRDLSFTYPGSTKPALTGISLKLPAGSTLAVVGKTGSGKSTLAAILLRLYEPPAGAVLVDGYDLRDIPLEILRRDLGYVPQDTFLFSTTIRENIALGAPGEVREGDIITATQAAHIYNEATAFPAGLDTMVGERGITLSGGQKQRVAIARALVKDPAILILDDCLSAVDARTEEQVLASLRRLRQGKTTIIISHRVSAVREADQILVLAEGRVVDQGNHRELVERPGLYRGMYLQQLLEEKLASD